jgi:hypothetical protein
MSEGDYEVGYGRPPVGTRFQKGGGGNRPGRKKRQPTDVLAILDGPVTVEVGGKKRRKAAFEVELTNLFARAIKGDVSAARAAIRHCEAAGLIEPLPVHQNPGILRIPKHWNHDEFMAMFEKHGFPPWPEPDDGCVPASRIEPALARSNR